MKKVPHFDTEMMHQKRTLRWSKINEFLSINKNTKKFIAHLIWNLKCGSDSERLGIAYSTDNMKISMNKCIVVVECGYKSKSDSTPLITNSFY